MTLSLKVRQAIIGLLLLLFILPLSFIAIERAFYAQLVSNTEQRLEVHLYSLISELTNVSDIAELSNRVHPQEFLRPDSGISAYIVSKDELLWQSVSSMNQHFVPRTAELLPGKHEFGPQEYDKQAYWMFSVALLFDMGDSSMPLTFHILQDDRLLQAPLQSFRKTLFRWFSGIAAMLTLIMLLAYYWTTQPLSALDHEIRQLEAGRQQQLNGVYPAELSALKEDLNLLLESQNRQKQRYRHHLSDLAHALKTPVAVLKTSPMAQQPELREQIDRITGMIEHQLKKASSSGQDVWHKQIEVKPLVQQLQQALLKIYRDKNISWQLEVPEHAVFRGDEADLMEMLGNLLDNACKACRQQVKLTVSNKPFLLQVEDDGPGVPETQRQLLLSRGTRLDTYSEGHGVGLSIVDELVQSYQGELTIGSSLLGGASFLLRFVNHHY